MTSLADELSKALARMPQLGAWVEEAAFAALDEEAARVFTTDTPNADDLAHAETVCWRGPVRTECADYAAQTPVHGLWGAFWRGGKGERRRAA